ncbi:MAG: chemotaxis-specific protein-glutamate methyltransferase CheB [Sulfuricella sp.]|nr:chemotaxis-specific protein-glutamate methyltransferase CheB [Sulfuricella sp.]
MEKIRVVLTDDSGVARSLLRSFLESDADIEVVGEAHNGEEAVRLARELRPNLITMDLEMPVMGGMQAIEEIMASKAVPILVVSSVADAQNAYEAVARGALEVIAKPEYDQDIAAEFVAKVKMLARVPVITHLRTKPTAAPSTAIRRPPAHSEPAAAPLQSGSYTRLFAIASSTGGPQALAQILRDLPANFPCPILVSQHISDGFAGGMADWLAGLCRLPVHLAREGELIVPGTVYVSPSEASLAITPSRRVTLLARQSNDVYRPICNALLNSAAEIFGRNAVGIILTGMGSDGAKGIAAIRQAGGHTLGQDEASSVIYGMNKVAIDAGNVQDILPASRFAAEMCRIAGVSLPPRAGGAR